jgi:recombination protein RecR
MAYHLLQNDRAGARRLADALQRALGALRHCQRCNTLHRVRNLPPLPVDQARCQPALCRRNADRHEHDGADARLFGLYYVLMGRVSPLDGIGPGELHLERLLARASDGVVREVIIATNFTNEGEATAHYLSEMLRSRGVSVSRIARGVPVGGELEYVDAGTLAQALRERRPLAG